MLSQMFWIFQKNSFIKKSVEQSNNKDCKKRYHKKSQLQKLLQYYCADSVKYEPPSKHLFQIKQ